MARHSAEEQRGNLTGAWVEYHGSNTAWYGHRLIVTDRQVTEHGPRYALADRHGRRVLTNVSPGSVTFLRTATGSTWAERLDAVRTAAANAGAPYARQLTPYLDDIPAMLARHDYPAAQRTVLDLEVAVGLIDAAAYHERLDELDATHGPQDQAAT